MNQPSLKLINLILKTLNKLICNRNYTKIAAYFIQIFPSTIINYGLYSDSINERNKGQQSCHPFFEIAILLKRLGNLFYFLLF